MSTPADTRSAVSSPEFLAAYQEPIQAALRANLAGCPPPLGTILRYHMGWETPGGRPAQANSGKALRPALCLLTCEAVGGARRAAMPAAVALELFHNFTLIHDDIQDQDRERRGRPTVWAVWGKSAALAAGNAMRAQADSALHEVQSAGAAPDVTIEALRAFAECAREVIEGQCMDLIFETRMDVTPEQYLDMVSRKTGALIEGAMRLGALLGGAAPSQVSALAECGRLLGLAFQVRDDALGIWGDTAVLGKATGADIRRKKKSLPVIYSFGRASGSRRRLLDRLYAAPGELEDDAVQDVVAILDDVHAHAYVQSLAEEMGAKAGDAARAAQLAPEAVDSLGRLADFMVHRDH